ncbi:hypothetical protein ACWDZ8_17925 [Streptomyces sp. NPDC003233]
MTAEATVHGTEENEVALLRVQGRTMPDTIVAILLELRDRTGEVPHACFSWSEDGPVGLLLRFWSSATEKRPQSPARSCAAPSRSRSGGRASP